MPRSLEFDPEEKLHDAMMLFWRRGYEATSLKDLVDGLGINRFSIYNTFGDKRALFEQALQHYEYHVFQKTLQPLTPAEGGLDCLEQYFENLRERLSHNRAGQLGCLLQNTALEGSLLDSSTQAMVKKMLLSLLNALNAVLEAAKAKGQIAQNRDIEGCAAFLAAQVQGIILTRKVIGLEAMNRCMDYMLDEIQKWKLEK